MEDKKIICRDCGKEFIFTTREQEFYNEKGFSEPKSCKDCREKRKQERAEKNNSENK